MLSSSVSNSDSLTESIDSSRGTASREHCRSVISQDIVDCSWSPSMDPALTLDEQIMQEYAMYQSGECRSTETSRTSPPPPPSRPSCSLATRPLFINSWQESARWLYPAYRHTRWWFLHLTTKIIIIITWLYSYLCTLYLFVYFSIKIKFVYPFPIWL